jgi:cell division protein FtsW
VLTITGLVVVYSASFVISLAETATVATPGTPYYYIVRQLAWAVLGVILMVVAMRTDYHLYQTLAVPIMLITIGMLIAVLVVGVEGGGARRWLGVGEFTVQPSEFAKMAVIIYLAAWLVGKGDRLRSFEGGLIPFVVIIGGIGLLVMLQPNLGTTLVILVITVTMFFVAGASFLQMVALGTTGIACIFVLATVAGYRLDRLTAYMNAETVWLHRMKKCFFHTYSIYKREIYIQILEFFTFQLMNTSIETKHCILKI